MNDQKPQISTFDSKGYKFTNFKYNPGREMGYAVTDEGKLL